MARPNFQPTNNRIRPDIGVEESQIARTSGLATVQFTYDLFQDPQYWVSDSTGASGAAITNQTAFTDILFPQGAVAPATPLGATAADDGYNVGGALPYAVTPCIRYTSIGTDFDQVLQLRLEGFDQFGEFQVEETPEFVLGDPSGSLLIAAAGTSHTYYMWGTQPFQRLTRIQYKLANKNANEALAVGIMHCFNELAGATGTAGSLAAVDGLPVGPPSTGVGQLAFPLGSGIGGTDLNATANYGLGAPVRLAGTHTFNGVSGVRANTSRTAEFEIVGGILRSGIVAPGLGVGGTGEATIETTGVATAGAGTITTNDAVYIIGPAFFQADPTQLTREPIRGPIGGFTVGLKEDDPSRSFKDAADKFGLVSSSFTGVGFPAPFRQRGVFAGETFATTYIPPTVFKDYQLTMTFRSGFAQQSQTAGQYPTKGF